MKKILTAAFILICAASMLNAKSKNKQFSQITAAELVKEMKTGWNLGNTLDANGCTGLASQESWGQPLTDKKMIDGIAEAGFKTIRIPVSWSNHITGKNHKIDKAWMNRVKQIVDWAIEDELYVIINIHHDNYTSPSGIGYGDGFYPNMVSWNESMLFIKDVWTQISKTFNNEYDEHLIFELLNEPRLREHEHEWWMSDSCNDCKYGAQTLNRLNQVALDAIRKSGGNNSLRFVMVSGLAAAPHSVLDSNIFKMPQDTESGRLLLSVHMYTPYAFAMQTPGETVLTESHKKEVNATFEQLNEKFISNGIPVVIGEYGATNKNNTQERIKWFTNFISESKKYGMCCCLWDNGDWNAANTYEEKFGFYNRKEQSWYFEEIIDAIMNCF
ncbi:glycoside hydrolase family 5 protein [Treponema rectale]|uniref:Endoglucanase n=1 Tax=Treponema rectale TaxID=744512 RepID=A0A840SE32_9SPIR|nr:endoglucanase [Treponema rectale]QOS40966.1 glycoside hydrolase family 5 protein [Treponema rectale]